MKKYFLTVTTYRKTTALGKLVAERIYDWYDKTIVSAEQLLDIPEEIENIMSDIIFENKRLKPMSSSVHGFLRNKDKSMNLEKMEDNIQIWIYSYANGHEDNRAFTINAEKILGDYSIFQEGGDK